jgi:peptidoglycan hydrolase-like protein with peptidoglycan-binding domain
MKARVLAPLVAALVGIVAGTSTALVTVGASDGRDGSDDPETITDPLGIGIPLVAYECTGEGLLVLGYGESSGAMREGMAGNQDLGLSYLETAESCDTNFGPERFEAKPTYAVVAGPYAGLDEPCAIRMTPEHRGDSVTALRDGNQISVKCVCVLDASDAPLLQLGMEATDEDVVWIRSLQQMLVDREKLTKQQVTGVYDRPTEAVIREYQSGSTATVDGVVDEDTWGLVKSRTCRHYDF